MAEQDKRKRQQALSKFTRNINMLAALLDDVAPMELVKPQFESVKTCWESLENAHDDYVEKVENIQDEDRDLGYLDEPGERHSNILIRYSGYLKGQAELKEESEVKKAEANRLFEEEKRKREARENKEVDEQNKREELSERWESLKLEVEADSDTFVRMTMGLKDSLSEASEKDMRNQWEKVDGQFQELKKRYVEFVSLDKTQDVQLMQDKFSKHVEPLFVDTQKWIFAQLKDAALVTSGGDSNKTSSQSSTKKEVVCLPRFQGEEKASPFVNYPIWKKQWNILIEEYDEKYRPGLLYNHLDEAARSKIVGYETVYGEAINRLSQFYGDRLKVVSGVMREVMSPRAIVEGDYRGLLAYGVILENNFNRLSSIGLEHEISNTTSMSSILKKFPRGVAEKWNDALSLKSEAEKTKPFPVFVDWLKARRETWERMLTSDPGKVIKSFYVDDPERNRSCFGCGETGHMRRSCPQSKRRNDGSTERRKPKIKQFWCALHKDTPDRRCFSDSCPELKKLDPQQRVKLLRENGDCQHCVRDHKYSECPKKDRVCGGKKEDRGCKKSHNVHELFCPQAKVFTGSTVKGMSVKDDSGVILLIMQVQTMRREVKANVFYDSGCTSNFVREEFARACGFKGKKEELSVTTLGGMVSDIIVTEYRCSLRDVDGNLEFFEAYGMETITGRLSQISQIVIKKLFPHLANSTIKMLQRGQHVDMLIGISHPSWQPERAEKAKGGDFWMYRGKFGSCVGGKHPDIREATMRSDKLFHVNHSYKVEKDSSSQMESHQLEFCPNRVSLYHCTVTRACTVYDPPGDIREKVSVIGSVKPIVSTAVPQNVVSESFATMLPSDVVPDEVSDQYVTEEDPVLLMVPDQLNDVDEVSAEEVVESMVATGIHDRSSLNAAAKSFVPVGCSRDAVNCFSTKVAPLCDDKLFFESEVLGTIVEPRCGACKCSKCPVPGSKYSLKEQQEYDRIKNNLGRLLGKNRWVTEYPWNCPRSSLAKNDRVAFQCLCSLERMLEKNPELIDDFIQQIQDMVERNVAVVLSREELESWSGDYYYLPLVGVKGKKRFRICFDAARRQCGGPSLNDCLLKGPDRFLNNLLSVIIGFRNGRVGAAADISRFHNQVWLTEKDMHMQRFLWRDMKKDESPKTYAVRVNNFGVKPANCIATTALHLSADQFENKYPVESQEMKHQTYIDDQLVAAESPELASIKTKRLDEILEHAGMPNKGWVFSGDIALDVSIGGEPESKEEKVLGLAWIPSSDVFRFKVILKFAVGSKEIVVSSEVHFHEIIPSIVLTRRIMLANVARIFDPVGFLVPIILRAKLLMRESWSGGIKGWDDPLSEDLVKNWVAFLLSLMQLQGIEFPRSLWPDEEVLGKPSLVIFSDGSASAFGSVAYIRWKLQNGGFWSRLLMAKGKIAPKGLVSIPRMELNGAVLGNRLKNFLKKETSLKFEKVYQLVDSSTVLGYVQKECGSFKPYEGIRVAEIQNSNILKDGKLAGWAWVAGDINPADWCTKPRQVKDLLSKFWLNGPTFLSEEESLWPIKHTYRKEGLEGELKIPKAVFIAVAENTCDIMSRLIKRYSLLEKIVKILARILRLCRRVPSEHVELGATEVSKARVSLLKFAQEEMVEELKEAAEKGTGRYRKLAPAVNDQGVWCVGSRLKNHVPFTFDCKLPILLPPDHRVTRLVMEDSHRFSHSGFDGTLHRFRALGYWTLRGGHLAKKVKNSCVTCRKEGVNDTLKQPMGDLPPDMFVDPKAWGFCQLDLFGPFHCRGDVNPRTTKKTWGLVIEDVVSGAVHVDVVQDYSAEAVLLSMRRFGSIRGWPGTVQSDPGSQLVSASGKLVSWWNEFEIALRRFATGKNFEWKVSPPDSPWRQGKAERRIGVVKRLIHLSVGDSRVTPIELQTIFFEIANICNERPLGLSKPREDGSYDIITPNNLLLGRSTNMLPDDASLITELPITSRYRMVHHVTSMFWSKWITNVSPSLIIRQKWHEKTRNLCVGDLVMICGYSAIKSKYKLAIVDSVYPSGDDLVRSVMVRYVNVQKNSNGDNKVSVVHVKRSIQRLVLVMPVEEQSTPLVVEDHGAFVVCNSIAKAGV